MDEVTLLRPARIVSVGSVGKHCPSCHGKGYRWDDVDPTRLHDPCPACGGSGVMTACRHYTIHRDHAVSSRRCGMIPRMGLDPMCNGQREVCDHIREIEERYRIRSLVSCGHTLDCSRDQVWGGAECKCEVSA